MKLVLVLEIALLVAAFIALHRALRVREIQAASIAGEAPDATARRILRAESKHAMHERAPRAVRRPC